MGESFLEEIVSSYVLLFDIPGVFLYWKLNKAIINNNKETSDGRLRSSIKYFVTVAAVSPWKPIWQ